MRTEAEIITDMGDAPVELTASTASEWVSWRAFFASAIALFESVLDAFKASIETIINNKQYGSIPWLREQALKFQAGSVFAVNDKTGVPYYSDADTAKQTLARCAVNEVVGDDNVSRLIFKVAKYNNTTDKVLQKLSDTEYSEFQTYVEAFKVAGTNTGIINEDADKIKLVADIYIEPSGLTDDYVSALKTALLDYRDNNDNNGIVKFHEVVAAISSVSGTYAVNITSLSWRKNIDVAFTAVVASQQLYAGYFNYDTTVLSLVIKNRKTSATITTVTTI